MKKKKVKKTKSKKNIIKKKIDKNKLGAKKIAKAKLPAQTAQQKLYKTNEQKIEIKKIKKQPNEKRIFNVNDYVVYPKHGTGKIASVEKALIGDIEITFYKVLINKEKMTLSIPLNQQSHLRPISSINQVNKSISILKSKPKIKRTMWSRRAQEYEQKINSGKIYELAEVVRDLNKDTDVIAEQSYSERQLFEKAYERLLSEFEVVLDIGPENTRKKMDKALKRNQEIRT